MIGENDVNNTPENNDSPVQPDPETLNKTDPQDNMEGPVSSIMQKIGEASESEETKAEADQKKEKGLA